MKKYVPFIFIAIMAGLVGAKVAIAEDAAAVNTPAQLEQQLG